MTTEQVIKDLNACLRFDDYGDRDCIECSQENWRVCKDNLMKQALDLINRQKAEIETLKAERNNYKEWYFDTVEQLKTAKSEAIKEFAERLKKYAGAYEFDEYGINSDAFIEVDYVDKLVKEMTEGKENA